jgi:large conductance mechanosensitive channel
MNGFKQFLLRGNVVDLAVGVVIGAAFTQIVTSFVKDLLTPLIGAVGGQPNFSGLKFTINKSEFLLGDFINAVISFAIVAAVVYFFVVLPMNKLTEKAKGKQEKVENSKTCPECQSEIPLNAKRCKYCTTALPS